MFTEEAGINHSPGLISATDIGDSLQPDNHPIYQPATSHQPINKSSNQSNHSGVTNRTVATTPSNPPSPVCSQSSPPSHDQSPVLSNQSYSISDQSASVPNHSPPTPSSQSISPSIQLHDDFDHSPTPEDQFQRAKSPPLSIQTHPSSVVDIVTIKPIDEGPTSNQSSPIDSPLPSPSPPPSPRSNQSSPTNQLTEGISNPYKQFDEMPCEPVRPSAQYSSQALPPELMYSTIESQQTILKQSYANSSFHPHHRHHSQIESQSLDENSRESEAPKLTETSISSQFSPHHHHQNGNRFDEHYSPISFDKTIKGLHSWTVPLASPENDSFDVPSSFLAEDQLVQYSEAVTYHDDTDDRIASPEPYFVHGEDLCEFPSPPDVPSLRDELRGQMEQFPTPPPRSLDLPQVSVPTHPRPL